ncbi:MAG: 50S ribosomal protein L18 [Prevotellaceae bacterium]|jgi:large subunit ribosomal protein L18|nr:50S ribosomal protein L18 [Prevotellaceae bacterium]
MALSKKTERRQRIKYRIRKIVSGTAERPRMSVYRSNDQIYVQLIDDTACNGQGATLLAASSIEKAVLEQVKGKTRREAAAVVGKIAAERSLEKGIKEVVFDRNGFLYHGRVKCVADAAREGGLKF